jgi:hypothetical protein
LNSEQAKATLTLHFSPIMPSGYTHDAITFILAVPAAAAAFYVTGSFAAGAVAGAAFLLAGPRHGFEAAFALAILSFSMAAVQGLLQTPLPVDARADLRDTDPRYIFYGRGDDRFVRRVLLLSGTVQQRNAGGR